MITRKRCRQGTAGRLIVKKATLPQVPFPKRTARRWPPATRGRHCSQGVVTEPDCKARRAGSVPPPPRTTAPPRAARPPRELTHKPHSQGRLATLNRQHHCSFLAPKTPRPRKTHSQACPPRMPRQPDGRHNAGFRIYCLTGGICEERCGDRALCAIFPKNFSKLVIAN
jgi:hypothetical protein